MELVDEQPDKKPSSSIPVKTRVSSVGVTDHSPNSGFPKLNKSANNALQVRLAFQETVQLNADPAFIQHLTSDTTESPPSRGVIISKLMELSSSSEPKERIVFYFSGHGHLTKDEFFLVPQDAYSHSDPSALLSLKQVTEIMLTSRAEQKVVILDICLSGPTLSVELGKSCAAEERLSELIADTKGIVFFSSSSNDPIVYEQSSHPKLSLFTSELVQALRGTVGALDGDKLTMRSLVDYISSEVAQKTKALDLPQVPTLQDNVDSAMLLGDFSTFIIPSGPVDFKKHPVESLVLKDSKRESTSNILTNWKNRQLTVEQLEFAANHALKEYLEADFGNFRSQLRKQLRFSASEIDNESDFLAFPGGMLSYSFKGQTKDLGLLIRELSLDPDWFDKPDQLKTLIETLLFNCDEFVWKLGLTLEPLKQIPSLEAKGWNSLSESMHMVKFEKENVIMTIEPQRITFEGMDILSMLQADGQNSQAAECIGDTLALLPKA